MLNAYLKRAGVVSGPLAKNTSHSGLEVIKNYLLGRPQFKGNETFLAFGNSLHQRFLEDKNTYQVGEEEAGKIDKMLSKLRTHSVVKSLIANSIREQKCYSELNGVSVAFILDINKPHIKTGADLKTTNCNSMLQCAKSAAAYGYFKQSVMYKKCARLKHFYFIFIQKEEPHDIFILDVSQYPDEERYAERELEFLLYFYKNYGKVIKENIGESVYHQVTENIINIDNAMAKTGKEHLSLIKEAAKEHKKNLQAANKATTLAEKSKARVSKLIESFPAKEKELYQEQLDKVSL